jgi:hypothetical protein
VKTMLRNQNATRSRLSFLAAAAILFVIPNMGVGQIRGPLSGVVFHRASRSLRPILGVPGGAYLGTPIVQDIDVAFIAPDGNCAFVTREFRSILICGLVEGHPTDTPIPNMIEDVDSVAWSRKGGSAALCSTGRMLLQVIHLRGSGEPAETGGIVDLSPLGAKPSTLAINDDGRQVVVGVDGGLYRISDDGSITWAAPIDRPAGAVFGFAGNTVYVLDQLAHEIRVVDAGGGVTAIALADVNAPDDDPKPVGLAVADDGGKVWVALAKRPAVRAYDTVTRQLESEEAMDTAPSAVQRITSGVLYLLNSAESAGAPFLVLRTGDPAAVLFVPDAPACEDCQ